MARPRFTRLFRLGPFGGLLAALALPTVGAADLSGQEPARCDHLSGEVRAGEAWERRFGNGLLFRLRPNPKAPPNPPGWTIEVREAPDGTDDFVWVATPPYRWDNPRYLDTGHGKTAESAVAWHTRSFGFVTSEEAREELAHLVGFLLWRPPGTSDAEYEAAQDSIRARWEARMEQVGRGRLRITGADVSTPEERPPSGRIERLAFEVTLCPGGEDPAEARGGGAGEALRSGDGRESDRNLPDRGRSLLDAPTVPIADATGSCLDLGWPEERGTLSDSLVASSCRVAASGELVRTDGVRWRWARYRRVLVYVPNASTPDRFRALFPDSLREDELVLFAGRAEGDRARPVWHHRVDAHIERIEPPRSASIGADRPDGRRAVLFVHRRCLVGTGGCQDRPFRLSAGGAVEPLEPDYLRSLEERLPASWGTWKGVHVDTAGPAAHAPVYLPADANCCPSFRTTVSLRLTGDTLAADSVAVRPDPAAASWRIVPAEARFGPVASGTSEAELRRRVGRSQVTPADVPLGEGMCTLGAHVFPGSPWAIEVAWTDSARSRPAFARLGPRSVGTADRENGPSAVPYRSPTAVQRLRLGLRRDDGLDCRGRRPAPAARLRP